VSGKYFGRTVYAPFTTPGPRPRSHCSSEAFFGPRFSFQSASPRASQSSAGLSSPSAARYFSISCSVLEGCWARAAPATAAQSRIAAPWIGFKSFPPRPVRLGDRRLVGPPVAMVVDPCDRDLVPRLPAAEAEGKERVLRYGGAPLGG